MNFSAEFHKLLRAIGSGQTGCTAYDTAWIARLAVIEPGMSDRAIQWICEHQLPDGSWGAVHPNYYHDRVISTLSAMLALHHRGRRLQDRRQIEKGLRALGEITFGATKGLAGDPNGATVGFELIVPELVAEAEQLGIIQKQGNHILGRFSHLREKKLAKLAGLKINRHITPAFSAEMAGTDMLHLLDVEDLQEANGSVGNSPSATAYFALHVRPGDNSALAYLREATISNSGGAPFASPFDVFERAWILWNLALLGPSELDDETLALCKPHLDFLESSWQPGHGVGFAASYTPRDGDDTSITFDALRQFGRQLDTDALLSFEEDEYFKCYTLEINPSIGANIHILGALRNIGLKKTHPSIQKIVKFLHQARVGSSYWLDKWHASPYYITAHAIIGLRGIDDNLCKDAVDWIIKSQNANGSWGFYRQPTAEETAYSIQALKLWQNHGGKIPPGKIEQGKLWLSDNTDPPYPPLWISKALYCPELVVKSAILSALAL